MKKFKIDKDLTLNETMNIAIITIVDTLVKKQIITRDEYAKNFKEFEENYRIVKKYGDGINANKSNNKKKSRNVPKRSK